MTRTEIMNRLEEIKAEEMEIAELQWQYGYMVDSQYSASLFKEKAELMAQLKDGQ